jgi:1-acyl-sn-glycerol-3-phosphate acyltransferase
MKFKLDPAASLRLQYRLGRLAVIFTGLISLLAVRLLGYRIRNIREVRKKCLREFREHRGPWIICANHLTMIDSVILAYGLQSLFRYMLEFRLLPWNLPEQRNFQRNIFLAMLCYLCKCIPIHRGGDRDEMKSNLDKCSWVLAENQSLMIFPEGGRSRTGKIDRDGVSYGVGRFVKDFDDCKIMCVYLRGDGQDGFSTIPKFGEKFTMTVETYRPERLSINGLRAQRMYAEQIIDRLARMEEDYFALHRQRHSGFDGPRQQSEERRCAVH